MWSIGRQAACLEGSSHGGVQASKACEVEVSGCEGASFEVCGGRRRLEFGRVLAFVPEA
jgi:hypothetical protein